MTNRNKEIIRTILSATDRARLVLIDDQKSNLQDVLDIIADIAIGKIDVNLSLTDSILEINIIKVN